jgi:hypothetical protein
MVSGGPVGVSGKRWVREWGFEAGQALDEQPLFAIRSWMKQVSIHPIGR